MYLHASEPASTSARILAATVELVAERGYAATTTRAIAEKAGVNEVTLFRQFGSKQGIIRALGESVSQTENPDGLDEDVTDIRGALHEVAERDRQQSEHMGSFATRLAMDAVSIPEVAEVMDSPIGPQASLASISTVFRAWQERGRMRADVSAELLAESFHAATGGMLMTRLVLGLGGDSSDIHAVVDLWCDAVLVEEP